ncbi:MAG TPA: tripartite tricarboxylate transporter substrate binding protein [Xanthobacteraceae bacterium]|nr:tripartite tricarboxylate transporter substrate binding protein [Xanthobacteraceae bacterium]
MRLPRRQFLRLAAGAAALPAVSRLALAQTYPTRPVRVIVPYAPGGPTDVCARLIAQKLSEQLGQQFYVENVPGAGGNIGTGQAARAAADGYVILITVNSHVINPTLYDKVPYDAFKDFAAVTLAAGFASALCVNPSVPANTVRDLVTLIKANPGKYSFASPGFGTPSHLLGEQFRVVTGLDLVHVPYGGSGPAIASVVAGHTPIAFAALSAAVPQVRDGRLRALAVMSESRSQALPELPTIGQAGYPGLEGDGWVGVLVPAGTPRDVIALLHREIVEMIALPDVRERLSPLGFDPVGDTPEQFALQMKLEMEKWAKVIRAANIRAQ